MKRNNNHVNHNVHRRSNNGVVVVKGNKTNAKASFSSTRFVDRPESRIIIKDWGVKRPGNIIPICNLKDLQMVKRRYTIIEFKNKKE